MEGASRATEDGWSTVSAKHRRTRSRGVDDSASASSPRDDSMSTSSESRTGVALSPRAQLQGAGARRLRTTDAPRWLWNPQDARDDQVRDLEEWALTADAKERIDLWKDWARRLRREANASPRDGLKPQVPAQPAQQQKQQQEEASGSAAGEASAGASSSSVKQPKPSFSQVFFASDALQNIFENVMRDWPPEGSGMEELVSLLSVSMDGGAEAHRRMLASMRQLREKLAGHGGGERAALAPQVVAAVCAAAAGLKHDLGAERALLARAEETIAAIREKEAALGSIPLSAAPSPAASPVLRGMLPPGLDSAASAGPSTPPPPQPAGPDRGAALAEILRLAVQRREALLQATNKAPFRARQSDLRAFFDHLLQSLEKPTVRVAAARRVDPEAEKRREMESARKEEARIQAEEEALLQRKRELEAELREVEGRLAQIPAAREKLQERLLGIAVRHSRLELQATVERPARERDFRPLDKPVLLASQYAMGELHGCIRDVVQARAGPRFDAARTAGIHFSRYALDHLRARRALLDGLQKRMQFVRGKVAKIEEEQRQSRDLGMEELQADPRQLQKLQAALEDGARLFREIGREVGMVVAHGRQLLTDGTLTHELRDFREHFEPLAAGVEAHVKALTELTGVDPAAPEEASGAQPAQAAQAAAAPGSPRATAPPAHPPACARAPLPSPRPARRPRRQSLASRSPTRLAGGGGAGAGPGESGRRKKVAVKPETTSPIKKAAAGGAGAGAAAAAAGRSPFLFLSHHARQKSSPDALLHLSSSPDL
eukprot:tig00001126_g7121.t1